MTYVSRTGPSARTVELIRVRDDWCCVRCGSGDWLQTHHRRPRGSGGTGLSAANYPSNLITLCLRCHAHVESERAEAYVKGWLVHMHHDPAAVPCRVARDTRTVWLSAEYADDPPEVADA